ncbi:Prismane/CO dehydrogenase family [Fragilaria crotonensis]|nr:Prismane/CO dehydrogenase family [Fragilaria crotonensis]
MFIRRAAATVLTRRVPLQLRSSLVAASRVNVQALSSVHRFLSAQPAEAAPVVETAMFCRQCEQTSEHIACTTLGVCGKTPETAAVQDALVEVIKSVSSWCVAARAAGATPEEMHDPNVWTLSAAFSTLTNVNFSEDRISEFIKQGMQIKSNLEKLVATKGGAAPTEPVAALQVEDNDDLEQFGRSVSVPNRAAAMGDQSCFSLNEVGTYGLKGACAYAAHCSQLGFMDEEIMKSIHEIWTKLASNEPDMQGLLATALRVGAVNAQVLALLDQSHATNFGDPVPSPVRLTAVQGKAILISGHDMADLHALLQQTEGTGINVFTHGEMLPAHSYPELRKFAHLAGNFGTAWQAQKIEFASFPGPIVVTTNCILEPRRAYKNRLFTMNEVGIDGVEHVKDRDFSKVIESARHEKGFPRTIEPARYHTVGFNHRVVLPMVDQIIDAAKSGALSRIFLIGGCDGSQWDRSYFTELAEATPADSLILTMGCAKNRLIHSPKLHGETLANGLPRVLDMGQCNDSYSAVVVALELAKALNCSVNDLPLSLAVSHLEQKAAAVLLTLLNLGVKNIRLGPSLPAYIDETVMKVLVDNYNLMPTGDPNQDMKAMMEGK